MLSPRNICLAPERFITVQTLVGVTQRHIQQRLFLLVSFQVERLECSPVWRDVLQIADVMTPPVSHQRPFAQVHLRRAVVGTRRKVHDFLLRLFRFDVGEKESPHRFRWGICNGRCGDCFRLCFLLPGLFTWYFRRDRRNRSVFMFFIMLPCQLPKFLPALRREFHHHLVEAVDGRIGIPVQLCIDVVRVGRLGGVLRFHLLILHCGFCSWSCRCNRDFRFGRSGLCRNCLFHRLFLFGGFRLADLFRHPPEVKQGELHACGILRARFYLRLFICGLRLFCRSFHRLRRGYCFQFYGRTLYFILNGNFFFRSCLPD